jgi:hypothetical protein
LFGFGFLLQMIRFLCFNHGAFQHSEPFLHYFSDAIPNPTGSTVEFGCHC